MMRPRGLERVRWHQECGHRVVVVTASFRYWIEPWCAARGIELIATKLQEQQGVLTGRFDGINCNGAEKVRRVRAAYDLGVYSRIWAYGNSRGDRPMLTLECIAHVRIKAEFLLGAGHRQRVAEKPLRERQSE